MTPESVRRPYHKPLQLGEEKVVRAVWSGGLKQRGKVTAFADDERLHTDEIAKGGPPFRRRERHVHIPTDLPDVLERKMPDHRAQMVAHL